MLLAPKLGVAGSGEVARKLRMEYRGLLEASVVCQAAEFVAAQGKVSERFKT